MERPKGLSAFFRSLTASPLQSTSAALVWLAAAITLVFSAIAIWVGFVDVPWGDHWWFIEKMGTLDEVFRRNNEHPIVTGHLVFWLDWHLFDARGRFLQVLIVALLAAQVPAFVWMAAMAGVKRPIVFVAPAAFAIILAVNGAGNLTMPFQVSYVPGFTLAVWTFATFAAYARNGSWLPLAISVALACVGMISLASSVFVVTIIALTCVLLKRRTGLIAYGLVALAGWIWMLASPSSTAGATSIPLNLIHHLIHYFLAYFGTPFSGPITPIVGELPDILIAIEAGMVVDLLAAAALIHIALHRRSDPAFLALGGIILFAFMNAAASALGRITNIGIFASMASHYHVTVSLLYVSVFIVLMDMARLAPSRLRLGAQISGLLFAALLPATLLMRTGMVDGMAPFHRMALRAEAAMVTGAPDEKALALVGGVAQPGEVQAGVARLRAEGKWMFADAVARRMGGQLTLEEMQRPVCETSEWSIADTPDDAHVIAGSFARRTDAKNARHVLIIDAGRTIVGYGLVARRISDLNPFAGNDGTRINWIGHTRPEAAGQLQAWLSGPDNLICDLGAYPPVLTRP